MAEKMQQNVTASCTGATQWSKIFLSLDLYIKAMEKLELYASTRYKNRADVRKSLKQDRLQTFTPAKLNDNAIATLKQMRRRHSNNTGWEKGTGLLNKKNDSSDKRSVEEDNYKSDCDKREDMAQLKRKL